MAVENNEPVVTQSSTVHDCFVTNRSTPRARGLGGPTSTGRGCSTNSSSKKDQLRNLCECPFHSRAKAYFFPCAEKRFRLLRNNPGFANNNAGCPWRRTTMPPDKAEHCRAGFPGRGAANC